MPEELLLFQYLFESEMQIQGVEGGYLFLLEFAPQRPSWVDLFIGVDSLYHRIYTHLCLFYSPKDVDNPLPKHPTSVARNRKQINIGYFHRQVSIQSRDRNPTRTHHCASFGNNQSLDEPFGPNHGSKQGARARVPVESG